MGAMIPILIGKTQEYNMKRFALYLGIAVGIVASCSTKEKDFTSPSQKNEVFYASFEKPTEDDTRVYANEDLLLRWTTDDRVSIFNKITYNQEYRFIGQTGDYEGGFNKVDNPEFMTGSEIPHIISVYPFQRQTRVSENEVITVSLPAEQFYARNSFGLGDNTMVSVSSGNLLQYKSVGGFLVINLYGKNVTIESITLKGNNGEKLAGDATVTMPLNGVPTAVMADNATTEITLTCDTPVKLSETPEECTQFWFVVPPVTFSKGFTITVSGSGGVFEKSTEKTVTIERNKLSKMVPIKVELSPTHPRNVIYYTSTDGNVVIPSSPETFGASILSNEYVDGLGVITFDGDVTSIGDGAFWACKSLTSITIPDSVTSIGDSAFYGCSSLTSITIPDSVTSIGNSVFVGCSSLTSITIPDSLTSIGDGTFQFCSSLISITIPDSVTSILSSAFYGCSSLTSITIPDSVTSIETGAFYGCSSLISITIPDSVTSIGSGAFYHCSSLSSITVRPGTPPMGDQYMFDDTNNCPIFVPGRSVDAYKSVQEWRKYADRIYAIGTPMAVDLGLPSGLKWASFNLGATKPEEYGDYYAWGETEPYYSCLDPLIWKEGKETGFEWTSYKWCMGSERTLTKYCTVSSYGYNGFTDNKTVLDLEDDAAYVNLGDSWRMPTDDEWTELRTQCSWIWTTLNGVNGYKVIGPTGNSIFLSATGVRFGTYSSDEGFDGEYWSSSLLTEYPIGAWDVSFISEVVNREKYIRISGRAIRPVYDPNNKVSISVEASAELLYDNGDSVRIDPIRYEGFHREYLSDYDLEDIFVDLTKNASSDFTSAILYLSVYDAVSGGLLRNESYGVVYNTRTGHYDFASI